MDSKLLSEVFLEEGDWIRYEGQYGHIARIREDESGTSWELMLREPDKKVWCKSMKKITLVCHVG